MFARKLGRSGIVVSAMGLGGWAIGGPCWDKACHTPAGWGMVDDQESIRAIQWAVEKGITFFDTADSYGCGHSEHIMGQALKGRRTDVIIATKFGYVSDPAARQVTGCEASPAYIRRACEDSLRRLNTDYIDLYQFHIYDYAVERASQVLDTLEQLVSEGKIRWYGWSTNNLARARFFAQGPHCTAIQHHLNILEGKLQMLSLCEQYDLASISRSPLSMGLLTGKFNAESKIPADDVRRDWNLRDGEEAKLLQQLERIRPILTSDGRTLAQAALSWLWARSERAIPIPGFKTLAQVKENVGALSFGPLTAEQMEQIELLLGRTSRS